MAWSTVRFRRCGCTSRLRRRIAAPTTPTRSPDSSQALDLDSTFALAGLGLASAAGWTTAPGAGRRGLERAWGSRDRLSPRDKALLLAEVGSGLSGDLTAGEASSRWERAVDLAPDQPERWYELGDVYFHEGPYLQIESYSAAGGGGLPPVGGAGLGHGGVGTPARGRGAGRTIARRCGAWRAVPGPRHERRAAGVLPLAHRGGAGTTSQRWPHCARSTGGCRC